MNPRRFRPSSYQICITILEARYLPQNANPLVVVKVGNQKRKTVVRERTDVPVYNEVTLQNYNPRRFYWSCSSHYFFMDSFSISCSIWSATWTNCWVLKSWLLCIWKQLYVRNSTAARVSKLHLCGSNQVIELFKNQCSLYFEICTTSVQLWNYNRKSIDIVLPKSHCFEEDCNYRNLFEQIINIIISGLC